MRRYGTGQQDILYTVEATAEGIRTTEAVPGGEGGEPRVVTGSSTVNGFGDLVRIAAANTLNGENVRTLAYDDKGRLIREQLADMAPTLYAYDAFGNRTKAKISWNIHFRNSNIVRNAVQPISKFITGSQSNAPTAVSSTTSTPLPPPSP